MALVLQEGRRGALGVDLKTKKLIEDIKAGKRKRKVPSRWGSEAMKLFIPGVPPILLADLDGGKTRALMNRIRIEEITNRVCSHGPVQVDETEERSPSPPPQYDGMGKRLNTRDWRIKHKLLKERMHLVLESRAVDRDFVPPPDFKPVSLKKTKRLYIPIKDYPDYNFIGLIIGPRGLTQKQMEKETGAKISIRGKGSSKDGRGRGGRFAAEDNDELHVLITADTNDQLRRASRMVEKLLTPVDENRNEHKRLQLRKLAEINGTLRDHAWERERLSGVMGPQVACAHCGEVSHPSSDCPFKGQPGFENKNIDKEFDMFLEAIGDKPVGGAPPPPPSSAHPPPPPPPALSEEEKQRQYEEFMRSLNGGGGPSNAGPPVSSSYAPPPGAAGGPPQRIDLPGPPGGNYGHPPPPQPYGYQQQAGGQHPPPPGGGWGGGPPPPSYPPQQQQYPPPQQGWR